MMTPRPPRSPSWRSTVLAVVIGLPAAAQDNATTRPWLELTPPCAPGAKAPELSGRGTDVVLSWIEPAVGAGDEPRHALRFARLEDTGWGPATTIAEGHRWFVNWADLPAVIDGQDGAMLAHWLQRLETRHAYAVELARSDDRGKTWRRVGRLHDDKTQQQHGFVSMLAVESHFVALWLDGRARDADPSAPVMQLRATRIDDAARPSQVVDGDVCSCCQTSAVLTDTGVVAVYRDHDAGEIRDISVVHAATPWSKPKPVHRDGWEFPGCPVNGPALATDGHRLAAAWYTAAESKPRVLVAFAPSPTTAFDAPIVIDHQNPVGRVDVAWVPDGAVVSWLARDGEDAALRLRRASPDGNLGEPLTIGRTSPGRGSGFPRLARSGDRLVIVWQGEGEGLPLRTAIVSIGALPKPLPR
ncbi:MAG: hypothetical protein AAF628_01570 [Planctomycetota bacterium]